MLGSTHTLPNKNLPNEIIVQQAGAELGQAQLMLEWDFTLIFCKFGKFSSKDLVQGMNLSSQIWFCILDLVYWDW